MISNTINDFWKIPREYTKNVVTPNKKHTLNDASSKLYRIELDNKDLLPKWINKKDSLHIFYNPKNKINIHSSLGDVYFYYEKNRVSLMNIGKKIEWFLDPDEIINYNLFEKYYNFKRPIYSRFPLPYNHIPPEIRNFIFYPISKLILKMTKQKYPLWPIEKSVEYLRWLYIKALSLTNGSIPYVHFWPDNSDIALAITHDIETKEGFRNINVFKEIEDNLGIKTSYGIVSHKYRFKGDILKSLAKSGHKVVSHGYLHDGRLPFLNSPKMNYRLSQSRTRLKEFGVQGFRSPQMLRTRDMFITLQKYFDYDMSIPDTEILGALYGVNGCATVFPYFINNLIEIPLTVPHDFILLYGLNMKGKQILNFWKEKVEWIQQVNGLASFNIHIDPYIFGNEDNLRIYEKLLKHLIKIKNSWFTTTDDIAKWWRKRNNLSSLDNTYKSQKNKGFLIKKFN